MSQKKSYESTVMRMAGNIAAGIASEQDLDIKLSRYRSDIVPMIAARAVSLAYAIVAEVLQTEEVQTPTEVK